jgi:hypothetical protein
VHPCRAHNFLLRRLFDAALPRPPAAGPGRHWGLRAVAVVSSPHLLERRPGFDAGPACRSADAALLELPAGVTAAAAAAAVNAARVDVLVDLWGWAPAGRAAGTLEVLARRPAAASVLFLGSVEGAAGLAHFTVRRPGGDDDGGGGGGRAGFPWAGDRTRTRAEKAAAP